MRRTHFGERGQDKRLSVRPESHNGLDKPALLGGFVFGWVLGEFLAHRE